MKRTLGILLACLVAFLIVAGKCEKAPTVPIIVSAPETTWVNAETPVKVYATASGDIKYIADLGNNTIDTVGEAASGETATVSLKWAAVGTYSWKMQAALAANPAKASAWTDPRTIYVAPNTAPGIIHFQAPFVAVKNVPAAFSVLAEDPEGDSIQFKFQFGDGEGTGWLDTMLASPAQLTVFHTYKAIDTVTAYVWARDKKRSVSAPCSAQVQIGTSGGVLWFAQPGGLEAGDSEPVTAAPVVVIMGSDTVVVVGGCDDSRLFSLRYSDGKVRGTGSPRVLDEGRFWHPAYCVATSHIICGNEDGRIYAFNGPGLTRVWYWPVDTMLKDWGTVAISGDRIYAPNENDTLYCLQDAGQSANMLSRYYLKGIGTEQSAPIIDNQGNVIVATVVPETLQGQRVPFSYIYKLDPNLTSPLWSRRVQDEIKNLCLDANANVYATTSKGKLYCLNSADGNDRWAPVDVDPGRDAWYMAMGENNQLYVGTGSGKLVAVDISTGNKLWETSLSTEDINAGLVFTTKKYLYALDDEDWLYCVDVSGSQPALVWKVDCPAQVRPGLRSIRLTSDDNACLTVGPDGDIIVIGKEWAFKVAGYPDGTLAPTQWPKWQRDAYNTGKY